MKFDDSKKYHLTTVAMCVSCYAVCYNVPL